MKTTLSTSVDAWVNEIKPLVNYGLAVYLRVTALANNISRAFIHFTHRFEKGSTVVSGKLRLYTQAAWSAGPHVLTVKLITSKWVERGIGQITYAVQPTVGAGSATLTVDAGAAGTPINTLIEIDVTALLQTVASGTAFYGFRVTVNTASVKPFHSSEGVKPAYRPSLFVEWTTAPGKPINLKPSGGRITALTAPTLSWQFVDARGEKQSEYQVQISTDSAFATVDHDPGYLASENWQHDLGTTAFTLADATVYYWRVRVKDNYGLASPYSDTASLKRDTHGVLTITNPSSGSPIVEETTPVITHTFTGETQEAMRYVLYEQDAGGVYQKIYDSGIRATADLDFTLPENLIRKAATNYRIDVYAFDTEDREATPDDPIYVRAQRVFTFVRSVIPTPVSALTAAGGTGDSHPGVVLEWTRASTPDFWAIKRNGVYLTSRLAGADAFVSGTTYRYTVWSARPNRASTYEVEAVTLNGGLYKHSQGDPTVVYTHKTIGRWLIAPSKGIRVFFAGRDAIEMPIADSGEVYIVPGRRDPVTIFDTTRGYEGSLDGTLDEAFGIASQTWRDRLETLRGLLPTTEIRLLVGDQNIPITIDPNSLVLTHIGQWRWRASLTYRQVYGPKGTDGQPRDEYTVVLER